MSRKMKIVIYSFATFPDITKSYKYVLAVSIQGTYFEN